MAARHIGRLFFGPPKVRSAHRSGRRMWASALPAGLNTMTPSRSSGLPLSWNTFRPPTSAGSPCSAPLEPQPHPIAVAVDAEAVERALIGGVDQLVLPPTRAVGVDVVAPDAAVRGALPLHDIELLLVRRERQPVRIDESVMTAVSLPSLVEAKTLVVACSGFSVLPSPRRYPNRIGEPDRVVGLHHVSFGAFSRLPSNLSGQHRDLAVLLGAGDAAGDRMLRR